MQRGEGERINGTFYRFVIGERECQGDWRLGLGRTVGGAGHIWSCSHPPLKEKEHSSGSQQKKTQKSNPWWGNFSDGVGRCDAGEGGGLQGILLWGGQKHNGSCSPPERGNSQKALPTREADTINVACPILKATERKVFRARSDEREPATFTIIDLMSRG